MRGGFAFCSHKLATTRKSEFKSDAARHSALIDANSLYSVSRDPIKLAVKNFKNVYQIYLFLGIDAEPTPLLGLSLFDFRRIVQIFINPEGLGPERLERVFSYC